ncbi:MAG: hypothetical protein AVDCRST_MAG53-3029, partial [uncultured Solirubrobacteraceae bacterium]
CSPSSGRTAPTASGLLRWSAPSRAGTTRAMPPPPHCSSSAPHSARRASPASTPRSSTTSRPPARTSVWWRARAARSTGPRWRSTPPGCRAHRAIWSCSTAPSRPCGGGSSCSRSSISPRRSGCRWSSRSAHCSPTSRTRGPCTSRASPPTRGSWGASGCRARTTKARRGSPAPSWPPARTPRCPVRHCGRACRTTSLRRRTRRPRWRSCASSRGWWACRSTPRSSSPTRAATRRRSPPPSRRIPRCRPSSSGWRRPRSCRRPARRPTCRAATSSRATSSASCASRGPARP